MTKRKEKVAGKWQCVDCSGWFWPDEMEKTKGKAPAYCKPCRSIRAAKAGKARRTTGQRRMKRRTMPAEVAMWACLMHLEGQLGQVLFKIQERTCKKILAGEGYKELRLVEVTDWSNVPSELVNYWYDQFFPTVDVRSFDLLKLSLRCSGLAHTATYLRKMADEVSARLVAAQSIVESETRKAQLRLASLIKVHTPKEEKKRTVADGGDPKIKRSAFDPKTDIVVDPVLQDFNFNAIVKVNRYETPTPDDDAR